MSRMAAEFVINVKNNPAPGQYPSMSAALRKLRRIRQNSQRPVVINILSLDDYGHSLETGLANTLETLPQLFNVTIKSQEVTVMMNGDRYDIQIAAEVPPRAFMNSSKIRKAYIKAQARRYYKPPFGYVVRDSIGEEAFAGSSLEYVQFLDTKLTIIGAYAFKDCQLQEIKFSDNNTDDVLVQVKFQAFFNNPLTYVKLDASVVSIAAEAFAGCMNLTTADIIEPYNKKKDKQGRFMKKVFPPFTQINYPYAPPAETCTVQLRM